VTDDLDQILLLLVGVFAFFIVLLVVLAGVEQLDDPPGQHSWSPRRWASLARQAGRDTRTGRRAGK